MRLRGREEFCFFPAPLVHIWQKGMGAQVLIPFIFLGCGGGGGGLPARLAVAFLFGHFLGHLLEVVEGH